jgi:hypothetical protein
MNQRTGKGTETGLLVKNPDAYFDNWCFEVPKFYWDIFGLRRVPIMDSNRNIPLRKQFIEDQVALGVDQSDASRQATKKFNYKTMVWKKFKFDINHNLETIGKDGNEEDDKDKGAKNSKTYRLDGYVLSYKHQPLQIQIIQQKSDSFVFAVFDKNQKIYTGLNTILIKDFEYFIQTGDMSKLQYCDPNTLPESGFKYELKRTVK